MVLFNTRYKLESKDLYLTKDNKLINSLISARNSQFFVLRNSSLLCYELFNWADYVKSMISADKLLLSLRIMDAILDQEPLMLRGIPKTRQDLLLDIKPLLSLLTVKIWPLIDKNDINRIKKFASISMLLLIKADMQDYLQEGLKKIMVAFGFQSVYFTYLNNFYQSGVIKWIGGGQLLEILDYYKSNQSQQKRLLFHAFSVGGL